MHILNIPKEVLYNILFDSERYRNTIEYIPISRDYATTYLAAVAFTQGMWVDKTDLDVCVDICKICMQEYKKHANTDCY